MITAVYSTTSSPIQAPVKPPVASLKWKMAQEVAFASLRELSVSLTLTAVACLFVATPAAGTTLVITALAIVAINTFVRAIGGVSSYHLLVNPNKYSKLNKTIVTISNYLAPINFTVLDGTARETLVHEAGHAVAASLLYKNANPRITIVPLKGGWTEYTIGRLSLIGKWLGEKSSRMIVTGAGPAAAMLACSIHFGIAHYVKKTDPMLSRYLQVTAIMSIMNHVLYAASALYLRAPSPGHDFVNLWIGGIHPVASIASMVALPIIVKLGLYAYDRMKKQPAQAAAAA